ncbi:IMP dehydrogenase [Anaerolineales bacterium HSG6]|nr:IMP dehydrogenase [Anaerolineales bacterium HSG6]MDM8529819.1 IMP dehydrogenase [Anaerolineales bacterium HSG25]
MLQNWSNLRQRQNRARRHRGSCPYKSKLSDLIYQFAGGIRSGMGYVGAVDLADLRQKAKFVSISHAAKL